MSSLMRLLPALFILVGCQSEADFSAPQRKSYEATAMYKNTFLASEIVDGNHEISEGGRFAADSLLMKEKIPSSLIYQQVTRNASTVQKRQGRDSRVTREEFDVSSPGILDLLLVIDNSKSMAEEKQRLSTKLEPLISAIKDTDWRIAVISMSDPCVTSNNLLKKSDSNIVQRFAKIVSDVPEDGNAKEQGFPMAIKALESTCFLQKEWVRPNSAVGVLLLSDEDNCSGDAQGLQRCEKLKGKNAAEMVSFLAGFRAKDQARVYALVKEDGTVCPEAPRVGTEYLKAVVATGGVSGSICADDYSDALALISKNVNRIVKREIQLEATPDLIEFKVEADGVPVNAADAWILVNDVVTLNYDFFKDVKKATFTYTHDAIPKFTSLPVVGTIAEGTLVVKFNNVVQHASTYEIDENQGMILFSPMPPDEAMVYVGWREDIELKTQFSFQVDQLREDTMHIKIDGRPVKKDDYQLLDQVITFATPPTDGAVISVSYKTMNHLITEYQAPTFPPSAVVKTRDKETGAPIDSSYHEGKLRFDTSEVKDGRQVTIDIDYGEKPAKLQVEVPEKILDGSIDVKVDGESGRCAGGQNEVAELEENEEQNEDGTTMTLDVVALTGSTVYLKCLEGDKDRSHIQITYKYETNRTHEFTIENTIPLGEGKKPTGFTVFIDGKETRNFTRVDRKFTLADAELGVGSKVEIEATTYSRIE